ncbi:Virus attachment protein p12 family, partial [Dysosmobacter welbionis]
RRSRRTAVRCTGSVPPTARAAAGTGPGRRVPPPSAPRSAGSPAVSPPGAERSNPA